MSFDPEYLNIVALQDSELPPDLLKLKQDTRAFIKTNSKYWSATTIAQFLGLDIETVQGISPQTNFKTNVHNILIVKPLEDAEFDSMKYQVGTI